MESEMSKAYVGIFYSFSGSELIGWEGLMVFCFNLLDSEALSGEKSFSGIEGEFINCSWFIVVFKSTSFYFNSILPSEL